MDNYDAIKKDKNIRNDRLRFTRNTVPSLFCYLAIILDVCYFILVYKTNNSYFYNYMIGISVIANLAFLLASFLSSEGVKNYKKEYCYLMLGLAVMQIIRIFIYPIKAYSTEIVTKGVSQGYVFEDLQLIKSFIYLGGSAACLVIGAISGIVRTIRLEKHTKSLAK